MASSDSDREFDLVDAELYALTMSVRKAQHQRDILNQRIRLIGLRRRTRHAKDLKMGFYLRLMTYTAMRNTYRLYIEEKQQIINQLMEQMMTWPVHNDDDSEDDLEAMVEDDSDDWSEGEVEPGEVDLDDSLDSNTSFREDNGPDLESILLESRAESEVMRSAHEDEHECISQLDCSDPQPYSEDAYDSQTQSETDHEVPGGFTNSSWLGVPDSDRLVPSIDESL